ncbi:tetratricopeptide repeat protein [Psychroserpens sp.]
MKIFFKFIFLLLLVIACKNKTPKPNPALASIELKRGDLVLCYGEQFGDVNFSLSCDYSVRETFDLALALLHSFEYSEAEKAFVKVLDADPECAMAYWGVAMSIYHAAWFPPTDKELTRASKILEVAKSIEKSEKENDYFGAIASFYTDWDKIDHKARAKKYEEKMEGMYLKYKGDTEAAIFYTLALYSTRDRVGKDYVNERKAGAILEALFKEQPNHPGIAHYIIHNYDNPTLASKALATARRYADIAPASSHAQHMPSHIFTRLGIWGESVNSNLLSAESSRCYTESVELKGSYFEELHAIDYLVYAYLQKGDNRSAEEQYDIIKSLNAFHPTNITAAIYPITAIPARLALENKNWKQAANLKLQEVDLNWNEFPWQKAIHHFARTLGNAHTKNFKVVDNEIITLKQLKQDLINQKDASKTIQIEQVAIQIKTAEAWLAFKKGNQKKGLTLMKEASIMENKTSKHPVTPGDVLPADELLGDMLMEAHQFSEALEAYEISLKSHPNRFNGLFGAALAAKKSGNQEKAILYFKQFVELTKDSNSDRKEVEEAEKFLTQIVI